MDWFREEIESFLDNETKISKLQNENEFLKNELLNFCFICDDCSRYKMKCERTMCTRCSRNMCLGCYCVDETTNRPLCVDCVVHCDRCGCNLIRVSDDDDDNDNDDNSYTCFECTLTWKEQCLILFCACSFVVVLADVVGYIVVNVRFGIFLYA